MKSRNRVLRLAVVGSGTTAYGSLLGIRDFILATQDAESDSYVINLFIDDREQVINYKSNQINRRYGFCGTSTRWHAVSHLSSDCSPEYKRIFESMYGVGAENKSLNNDSSYIYVPFSRPNMNSKFRVLASELIKSSAVHSYSEIRRHVTEINRVNDSVFVVKDSGGHDRVYDVVLVCISILDIPSIKYSGCNPPQFSIIDHDQVHLGVYKPQINENVPRPLYTSKGFFLQTLELNEHCVMQRPWHSDVSNISIDNFQNFGKSVTQICKETILSGSVGKVKEAFATRFGLFYNAKYFSLWLQTRRERSDTSLILDGEYKKIDINKYDFEVSNFLNSLNGFIPTGYVVPGNHLIGECLSIDDSNKKIQFLTILNRDWMKGRHHTLSMCTESYRRTYNMMVKLMQIKNSIKY